MEPYRPFVDHLVWEMVEKGEHIEDVTTDLKAQLLLIPAIDVFIDGKNSPLMNAMSRTTNSLWECFYGSSRKIKYPEFQGNFLKN
jgi:CRISPR-associated protein Cas1